MEMENSTETRIRNMLPLLDERQRRLYLANEAKAIGRGGISQVSRVSGVSRVTITQGMAEINSEDYQPRVQNRCRKKGGGRKRIDTKNPEILRELETLLEPYTKGNPMNPLRWSSRSMRKIEKVLDHDFPIKELGKATPYGIYDIMKNAGFVNVGVSSDTAEFAVTSIKKWWLEMGRSLYPNAKSIYITADSGGSNGVRVRLWKVKLQELSDELGLELKISHFPAGTSKWNKIEHRLFSFISKNWRGKPLVSLAVIVNLISATKTDTGLTVKCVVDHNEYQKGVSVSDDEYANVNLHRDIFHGDWNYSILPRVKSSV